MGGGGGDLNLGQGGFYGFLGKLQGESGFFSGERVSH